jgi:hypothetical protein
VWGVIFGHDRSKSQKFQVQPVTDVLMFQIELTKWKHIPQIPLKWWLISLQSPTQPVSSVTAGGGFSRGSVIEDRVWCRSGGDARHLGSKLESDDQSMSPAAAMRRDRRQV